MLYTRESLLSFRCCSIVFHAGMIGYGWCDTGIDFLGMCEYPSSGRDHSLTCMEARSVQSFLRLNAEDF